MENTLAKSVVSPSEIQQQHQQHLMQTKEVLSLSTYCKIKLCASLTTKVSALTDTSSSAVFTLCAMIWSSINLFSAGNPDHWVSQDDGGDGGWG